MEEPFSSNFESQEFRAIYWLTDSMNATIIFGTSKYNFCWIPRMVANWSVTHFISIVDRNECNTGIHDRQQKCVNEHGSFPCSCIYGYQLNSDKKTCSG